MTPTLETQQRTFEASEEAKQSGEIVQIRKVVAQEGQNSLYKVKKRRKVPISIPMYETENIPPFSHIGHTLAEFGKKSSGRNVTTTTLRTTTTSRTTKTTSTTASRQTMPTTAPLRTTTTTLFTTTTRPTTTLAPRPPSTTSPPITTTSTTTPHHSPTKNVKFVRDTTTTTRAPIDSEEFRDKDCKTYFATTQMP